MISIERVSVMNLENAIRGARNPLNSWDRSDSYFDENGRFVMGENDLNLAQRLCASGSDHRKLSARFSFQPILPRRSTGGRNMTPTR
jgi:hypothetical protein